jgi:hypothetical protein
MFCPPFVRVRVAGCPGAPGSQRLGERYKAGLELVLAHAGAEREAYVQELKDAVLRYVRTLAGDVVN